jgi:hypothetical protein
MLTPLVKWGKSIVSLKKGCVILLLIDLLVFALSIQYFHLSVCQVSTMTK